MEKKLLTQDTERKFELEVEAVDLNDLDTMEESFSPSIVCGCGCGNHCGAA